MADEDGWISVSNVEEAAEKVASYETATTSRFCVIRSTKNFGKTGRSKVSFVLHYNTT